MQKTHICAISRRRDCKTLAEVQPYYEKTTDLFINNLLDMYLTVEEIKSVAFYKGLSKGSINETFYPLSGNVR